MPCYCDNPDPIKDQDEIQRRAKETMYFDVQALLTREQLDECEKQKIKQFPVGNMDRHLCRLCKILTLEQMKKISAKSYYNIKWKFINLYDWYLDHCIKDYNSNIDEEQERALSELKKLGFTVYG